MGNRHTGRVLAFKALYSWELNNLTVFADIISIESDECQISDVLKFGSDLFEGVICHISSIDGIIKSYLNHWDMERLEKVDLSILRLGVFSLVYLKQTSRIVTINEAINLSKEFGSSDSYRFINGILDSIIV